MKAYTTIKESKQLIEAGLDVNTADMYYQQCCSILTGDYEWKTFIGEHLAIKKNLFSYRNGYIIPCWSLAALLNIIDNNGLIYDISNDKNREFEILVYEANYISQEVKFHHTEHSIVNMIIWLLKNNYIKNDTDTKYIIQREDGLFYWRGWASSQHGWEKSFDKAHLFNNVTSATTRAKQFSHLYTCKVKPVTVTLEKENYE